MSEPKGTVLVVDDYDDGRNLLNFLLTHAGYGVVLAADGAEALARLDEGPDLVILDVQLPDIDGFEVCRRIKMRPRSALTPVVMVSAVFSQTEHRVRGLIGGADAYLPKPFEPELLVATVEALMRQHANERALAQRNRILCLDYELTRMLVEPPCVAGDSSGFLHAVAAALDADMAEFWRVEPGEARLARAGVWQSAEIDAGARGRSPEQRPAREEQSALQPSIGSAENIDFRSTTVVPVLSSRETSGAVVLFHLRAQKSDDNTRHLVSEVRNCIRVALERPGAARALGLAEDGPHDLPLAHASHFTADVAHQLETILLAIGVRAELLKETLPAEVSRRQELDTIIGATKRATGLLHHADLGVLADDRLAR